MLIHPCKYRIRIKTCTTYFTVPVIFHIAPCYVDFYHKIYHQFFLRGNATFIRLGELDYQNENDDSDPQNFTIIQIVQHPEYKEELTFYDDIALFKLNKKAKLTAYVRPACLWTKREIKNAKAIATGWGRTSDSYMTESSHLLKVTLSLIPHSECNHYENPIDNEKSICAGMGKNDKSIKNTCQVISLFSLKKLRFKDVRVPG